jgi:hypothetical protein
MMGILRRLSSSWRTAQGRQPCVWDKCLAELRKTPLQDIMNEAAPLMDEAVLVDANEDEVRKFVIAKELAEDASLSEVSETEPADSAAIFFSLADGPRAVVHVHSQPWSKFDLQSTPWWKKMKRSGKPLNVSTAAGEGLDQANSVGRICPDCESLLRSKKPV